MKLSSSLGRALIAPSENFYRTESDGARKTNPASSLERSSARVAPSRQLAHDVFFRHAAPVRVPFFLRSPARQSRRNGARAAVARVSFHRHPRADPAISGGARESLSRGAPVIAARQRRPV